jgi:lysophospholipase L1-like esterase
MRKLIAVLFAVACVLPARAGDTSGPLILKKGQRVAVVGDSITEQKLYSKYIEVYLLACLPELDLKVIQLGWGGETAPGFAGRMANDLLPWKADVVTTCYGMNDGGYKAFEEATGRRYAGAMADIVARCKQSGAIVVVGSPGAVDTKFFKGGGEPAKVYNATLAHLRDLARKLADDNGFPFANVHDPLISAMEKGKAALGEAYDVCGKDGVHPGPDGQLVMAYAFLKAMGIDGNVGTVTVDLKGKAAASDGHKVVSGDGGKIEVESARWPFCFSGDEKSPGGTRSILPFVPFNADLNRFALVVKNLDAPKAKVTWGGASKSFPREELEKGVNLMDHFFENPFTEPFRKLEGLVGAKQNYETVIIKQGITFFPRLADTLDRDKAAVEALEAVRKQAYEKQDRLHAACRAAVVPVKHAILVEPEK